MAFAAIGVRAGALDRPGAAAGCLLGLVIWCGAGWPGWCLLALFVVLGSAFTRLGYAVKRARGAAQSRRGRRGWRNAVANAAVAAGCAAMAGTVGGLYSAAFVGAAAAAFADTAESELGSLFGRPTWLPPRFRRVPPGTEGAVSLAGTLAGLAAALLLAALAAAGGLIGWPLAAPVALAAVAATFLESFVAAGRRYDNHLLNLLTTASGAVLAAAVARAWTG